MLSLSLSLSVCVCVCVCQGATPANETLVITLLDALSAQSAAKEGKETLYKTTQIRHTVVCLICVVHCLPLRHIVVCQSIHPPTHQVDWC